MYCIDNMSEHKYSKLTIEGDIKIKWICGCFQTVDDYFKFCNKHNETLKKAIQSQVDELDMTLLVEENDQIASIATKADTKTIAIVLSNLITVLSAGPAVSL